MSDNDEDPILHEHIQQTPDLNSRELRRKHTPTPKMSDRKKSLFICNESKTSVPLTINENSDSDLGPMSPLQFSCSPTHDTIKRYMENGSFFSVAERRINFANSVPNSEIRDSSFSPSSIIATQSTIDHKIIDSDKENSISKFSETERYHQQKTPIDLQQTINIDAPRITYRKSLIFDTGLTPDNKQNEISPKTKSFAQIQTSSTQQTSKDVSKAKISLSFSNLQISSQAFYGSSIKNNSPHKTKRDSLPTIRKKINLLTNNVNKPRKQRRKLSKLDRLRPTLGNVYKGAIHKITKPKNIVSSSQCKFSPKNNTKWMEEASKILMNSPLNEYLEKQKKDKKDQLISDDTQITLEQTKRLHEVLKNLRTTIDVRPLNWNVHGIATSSSNNSEKNIEQTQDPTVAELEALAESELEKQAEEEETRSKRKFFKSNRNSIESTYRLTKNLTATVKRGCTIRLQSPQKKKAKLNDPDNYDEYLSIQQEISGIITMLNTDQQNTFLDESSSEITPSIETITGDKKPTEITGSQNLQEKQQFLTSEDFRAMLPYNTNDPDIHRTQEHLLELLISHDICTAETFKIFIAEKELHKDEASQILNQLYVVSDENMVAWTMEDEEIYDSVTVPNLNTLTDNQNNDKAVERLTINDVQHDATNIINVPVSPASQISDMTSVLALGSPKSKYTDDSVNPSTHYHINDADDPSKNLYPIFRQSRKSPSKFSSLSATSMEKNATSNVSNELCQSVNSTKLQIRKWKQTTSNDSHNEQLQIDAGQKEFGSITCKHCGMLYTLHEPEEEILHLKYHNSLNILQFKAWSHENLVASIHEWGVDGRIICVKDTDSKQKLNRIRDLLEKVVDNDLGYCIKTWIPMTWVYLAIAKGQIIGTCVVEPIKNAYRLITENGVSAMDTRKQIPVKCGISRIWVAPPFRRIGVATKLLLAVQMHYISGYNIFLDEIAYSSPTEMGTFFAKKFNHGNVLVYDGF